MIELDATNFYRKLDRLNNWFLGTQFTQDALVKGSLLLARDIRHRVEQTGVKSDGSKFRGYSTKPILVGEKSFEQKAAWNQVFNQAKGAKEGDALHWVTIKRGGQTYRLVVLPGGYKKVRELEGRQTAHKSFNRTSFMWQGFGIKGSAKNTVLIGGRTPDSQNKINWNSARERVNIIDASTKEEQKLADFVNVVVQQKIKEFFG